VNVLEAIDVIAAAARVPRDHNGERGPVLAPERCHACHRPAVAWVRGSSQTLPECSVCRWARTRSRAPAAKPVQLEHETIAQLGRAQAPIPAICEWGGCEEPVASHRYDVRNRRTRRSRAWFLCAEHVLTWDRAQRKPDLGGWR
jgi:hypothetical protein